MVRMLFKLAVALGTILVALELTRCCNDGKYLVGSDKLNWHEAFINCGQNGHQLAIISSADEQKAVEKLLETCEPQIGFNHGFWISAMRLGNHSGKWFWFSNQKAVGYTNWAPGQPDFYAGLERCAEIMKYTDGKFYWNDLECDPYYVRKRYICQVKPETKSEAKS